MKTAILALYRSSLLDRLSTSAEKRFYDSIRLYDSEEKAKKDMEVFYSKKPSRISIAGVINFEDNRNLNDIAQDFSRRFSNGILGFGDSCARVDIPQSQRPIIKQVFLTYFTRK